MDRLNKTNNAEKRYPLQILTWYQQLNMQQLL